MSDRAALGLPTDIEVVCDTQSTSLGTGLGTAVYSVWAVGVTHMPLLGPETGLGIAVLLRVTCGRGRSCAVGDATRSVRWAARCCPMLATLEAPVLTPPCCLLRLSSCSCNIPAGQTQPIFPSDSVTFDNTCDSTEVGCCEVVGTYLKPGTETFLSTTNMLKCCKAYRT